MIFSEFNLKNRNLYLNKLIAFQDTEPVKVITGIRRCGKSSLMRLMIQHLKNCGVSDEQIIFMNFESMEYRNMDSTSLYNYIKDKVINGKTMYLFFDEIQKVEQWQEAINSFRVDFQSDITGSNAYLLSSEFSTYLAGRYVEIKMLPLSFAEFIDFNNYTIKDYKSPTGELRKRIYDANGEIYDIEELFEAYLKFGGIPGIADVGLVQDKVLTLLDGIYSTIVVRDILEREKRRRRKQITDPDLLRKIIMFLADNIGNNTSITSIGNTLVNEGLIDEGVRKAKPAVKTVQSYVGALLESYVFYEIKRFDIKGKDYLRTLGKYYIVDSGLRNYLLGFRDVDRGHVLENIVYFELIRRGYDVAIGKVGNKEVDFIATKADDKKYIQVTETMAATETKERELTPLKMIRDNYEKIILTMDRSFVASYDGIKIVNLVDWLVGE
jgi:hypothetical protein